MKNLLILLKLYKGLSGKEKKSNKMSDENKEKLNLEARVLSCYAFREMLHHWLMAGKCLRLFEVEV